jgi:copper(I)-binding protein
MRFWTLFLVLALTGTAQAAPPTITDGWFRALPPSVPSGGYFTLHNGGGKTVTLTGAQSPACGMLMLHRSMNHGGMGMMSHVTTIDIAPGATLQFSPGGYHLMCMDSRPVLKPGARVPVTLTFAGGQAITASFAVRNAAGK